MSTNQKMPPSGNCIPPELYPRLAELHILCRPKKNLPWEPTDYGRSLGLVRKTGGPLFALPDRTRLDEALSWSENPKKPGPPQNWVEIMEFAGQGLLCSSDHAASVVAALGAMPLEQYMADDPNGLQFLRRELNLSEGATYQEAADGVYRTCASLNHTERDYCMDLIFTLTGPLYLALNTMQFPAF